MIISSSSNILFSGMRKPENWDNWSVERQIGYNLALEKIKEKDPVFEPETTGDRIADFIGTILTFLFVTMMILTILALITIIGVELGSAIW